jgi:hypothetical protein
MRAFSTSCCFVQAAANFTEGHAFVRLQVTTNAVLKVRLRQYRVDRSLSEDNKFVVVDLGLPARTRRRPDMFLARPVHTTSVHAAAGPCHVGAYLVWKNDTSSCPEGRCRAVHARSASAVAHRIAIRASIKNQCKRSGVVSQGWGVAKVGCKNSNLLLSNTRHLLPSLVAPSRR